jgi:DNA-binding NarL/FixJ family response regulator
VGLALIAAHRPKLMLLDLILPVLKGLEVLKRLRCGSSKDFRYRGEFAKHFALGVDCQKYSAIG